MKKYRPNTSAVVVGITLMAFGLACWLIRAAVNRATLNFLLPLGLLLVCCGGLELTIVAFITLRKNDLQMRKAIEEKEKKEATKKGD